MLLPQAIPAIEEGLTAISILVTLNAAGDEGGVVGVCVGALVGVAVGALVGEVAAVVVPDGLPLPPVPGCPHAANPTTARQMKTIKIIRCFNMKDAP
jgi:hypothetical protein